MSEDTRPSYLEVGFISTLIVMGFASILVLLTGVPYFFLIILIPTIAVLIWAAIEKTYNAIKCCLHKKAVADNPFLVLMETLQNDAWGYERQSVRIQITELFEIVKHLSSFPLSEISDELLIFAEAANTMLTEYKEKAKMLYRLSEFDLDATNGIGFSLITKITKDLNVLVDKWAKNTADNLQVSIESWETTLSSSGVLTDEEEALLSEMEQENE